MGGPTKGMDMWVLVMRPVIASILLVGVPFWIPVTEEAVWAKTEATVVPTVAAANAPATVWVSSTDETAASRGWLGVYVDRVPEPLAAQLDLQHRGLVVLNVQKDSPADRYGIEVHDVIISVGGKDVGGDINSLAGVIQAYKPGDRVGVVLLRSGREKTLEVEIGQRPADLDAHWKFEPMGRVEERIRTHGKIIGKGPGGKLFIKDLGDVGKSDLSEQIKVLVPHAGSQSTEIVIQGDRRMIRTTVKDDGSSIRIERESEGAIEVEREDKDGKRSEATYQNEDELRQADPEAYELFSKVDKDHVFHLDLDGLGISKDVTIDLDDLKGEMGDWKAEFEVHMQEAREAMERAREELQDTYRELAERFRDLPALNDGRSEQLPELWSRFLAGAHGKPRHSFKVLEDGSIEVRTRKGDSELVRTFQNESDFARRAPDLYEKYREVTADEE
jgi:hypothetical protein